MRRRTVDILAFVVTLPALVLGVGFLFHTSWDATLLGKYSYRYAGLLATWFLLVVPGSFLLGRLLFRTHHLRLSRGRLVPVGPWRKIGVLLVGGLVAYVVVDAYLGRLIASRTMSIRSDVFHPYLQNIPNPASEKLMVNAAGFRGWEITPEKTPDTCRIMVFGGSTVLCGSLRPKWTHCGLLEKRLRESYPDVHVEVMNAGGDWHSSQHSVMKLLFQAQDYDPDLVIIYHAVNDLLRSLSPTEFARGPFRPDYGHYLGAVVNLVDPSRARRAVFRLYFGSWFSDVRHHVVPVRGPNGNGIEGIRVMYFPKARPVEVNDWPSLRTFERNMSDFVEIARRQGARVILATQPYLYHADLTDEERMVLWFPVSQQQDGTMVSLGSMIDAMERFNAATTRIAATLDVDLVDLERAVPKNLEHFYDDVHYTRVGNAVVARAFHDYIVSEGIIPSALTVRAASAE